MKVTGHLASYIFLGLKDAIAFVTQTLIEAGVLDGDGSLVGCCDHQAQVFRVKPPPASFVEPFQNTDCVAADPDRCTHHRLS